MTKSIPLSYLSKVTPSVIAAGGSGVAITGVLLTTSTQIPIGTVQEFASPTAVGNLFGDTSDEYLFAVEYFQSFDDSTIKPSSLYIAQFTVQSVAAYLRAGELATLLNTLVATEASPVVLTINGTEVTSGSVDLSTATSFSACAALLETAIGHTDAQFTASISGNVMTVTAATGFIGAGATIAGAGIPDGVTIVDQLTPTTGAQGGVGTYQLSQTFTNPVASEALTSGALVVTYDSQQDAFLLTLGTPGAQGSITVADASTVATAMKLTTATGAQVSPGDSADVPATYMNSLVKLTTDWVTFTTLFEGTTAQQVAFAAWNSAQNGRYAYVPWSTDILDTESMDTASAFYQITAAAYAGVHYIYAPTNKYLAAAAIMGAAASIDFNAVDGRITFASLVFAGLAADVADVDVATVLEGKGINFYGVYGGASETLFRYYPGTVTGEFLWFDSYINQIWLNDACQVAMADLMKGGRSFPYNTSGYARVTQALSDPIEAALDFGAIRTGITLSNAQAAQANALAGATVANTIQSRGWVLVIQAVSATVRATRQSPPMYLIYTDGQSIQRLNLSSVEVQ